jgi:hypothetical protein
MMKLLTKIRMNGLYVPSVPSLFQKDNHGAVGLYCEIPLPGWHKMFQETMKENGGLRVTDEIKWPLRGR